MTSNFRGALLALALAVAGGRAHGAAPAASALSADDQSTVASVVDYLQGLTTAKGRFVQTDARGGLAEGTFYLQRPGRARFDYDLPSGLTIASNGRMVSVVDRRLKTIQSYPLGMTPLGLFLARDIRLDRGVVVTQVTRGRDGLTVVAQDGRRKSRAKIALDFSGPPVALTGWTLTDARGGVVKVRLEGFERSEARDASFFQLSDPRPRPDPDSAIR